MLVLLALFCCLRPRLYILAALGWLATGWGLVDLLKNTSLTGSDLVRLAALSAIGAIAAGYAFKRSRKTPLQRGDDLWWLAGILALMAGSSWLAIAFAVAGDGSALLWYKALHAYPLAGTSLFGMAGLIAIAGRKRQRYWLAGLMYLAAAVSLFPQSAYFGKHWTGDPFAPSAAVLRWDNITLQPAQQLPLQGDFSDVSLDLRLSPQAQLFAYRLPYSELSGADIYRTFTVANFNSQQTTLSADDIEFVDERHLLLY